jgi:hypothetical protein
MNMKMGQFFISVMAILSMTNPNVVFASDATPDTAKNDPIWCPLGVTPRSDRGGCSPRFSTLTGLLKWLRGNDPDQAGTIWIEKAYDSAAEGVRGFTLDGDSYVNFDNHPLTIQGGWNGPLTTSVDVSDPSMFSGDFLHIRNWQAAITVNNISVKGATDTGLAIHTTGNINLSNIASGNNHAGPSSWAFGLDLDNNDGGSLTTVALRGKNVFNDNDIGLRISSNGDVVLNNLTVSENGVQNPTNVYRGYGAAILLPASVTLRGTNVFNDNQGWGLHIFSTGTITAERLTASRNESEGIELANDEGSFDINLDGPNVVSGNGGSGLRVFSNGRIRLADITADGNGLDTIWLERDGIFLNTSAEAIIECAKIYRNGGYGVDAMQVIGLLTLNDVTFNDNISGLYSYGGTANIQSGGCSK